MREMKDSGIEWIGEIPADWELSKIGAVYEERNEKVSDVDFQPLSVTKQGVVPQLEIAAKTNDGENRKLIRKNDFVINSRSDRRGSCGISEYDGSCSLINTVLKPRRNMCNAYYSFVFRSERFADEFYRWGNGIVDDLWSTKWSNMKRIYIPAPSLQEQHRISDYLDRKCSQIDAIIARQQEVIERLKAYKLSVITEVVTKGLSPNVPMKDSGVEWIGEIPEHWRVPKIKYLATISSGGTPDRSHPEYWNGSINWAKTGELQNNELYETEEKITELALENSSAKVFSVDTILVAMYGQGKTRGMTALLKVPSATNQACAGITVYSKDITVNYLWIFLMGAYDAIREKANGSGQPNLSGALIADFNVTLPPIEEQMNICKTVAMRLPHIDSVVKQKETIVDKLIAYKKSLIYAGHSPFFNSVIA